ncbi:MAG: 1-acyl-sn-glycerol-3-phosphate acyltransferase [Bacteroidales bacterium]|nr:1-acyl-sn-glycerol-3-phosphate acyltransferase [Bacteroidales bacterium]
MPLLPVSELEKLSPVFRGKAGNVFAASIRKLLSISKLSDLYDEINTLSGPEFARGMLERLEIEYQVTGAEKLADLPDGPFITVSNHPYGGIDGIILVDLIGHMRDGFKVMVNEFLNLIEPLRPNWIAVNPKNNDSTGVSGKNIRGVKEVLSTLRAGNPVGFFPSGAVSDLKLKTMTIRDRKWQESLIRLIQKAEVPIVPIRFYDRNSLFFYLLGLINWKVRLLRLPHELVNKGGEVIRVGIGDIIPVEEQRLYPGINDFCEWLRNQVDEMPFPDKL